MTCIPHGRPHPKSRHAHIGDECVGVRATKEASALKLVAACQVKLTPRVLWPLCRWTIEPRIRMKQPSAVTKPVFVSAAARPLSLAALMSFSSPLGFQMHSGWLTVNLFPPQNLKFDPHLPHLVVYLYTCTHGSLGVGHLAIEGPLQADGVEGHT